MNITPRANARVRDADQFGPFRKVLMDSPTVGAQTDSTHGDIPSHPNNAVGHLQRAARTGRPALIPGALEPRHPIHETHEPLLERAVPPGPTLNPGSPDDREKSPRDREAGGTPA